MQTSKPELPEKLGSWTRSEGPRLIDAANIFEYMNGAGELYLGYRFDRLEVYEYSAPEKGEILVELYFMKTEDDAFGLLSLDWGGEPVSLELSTEDGDLNVDSWPTALYGDGLLRFRSEALYARILAFRATEETREAVLSLGRAVVEGRQSVPAPSLVAKLPDSILPDWKQRRDRTSYFRSHLVLNSLYYLSQENMFDLGQDTEAVISTFKLETASGPIRIRLLLINHRDDEAARGALAHFRQSYLPEYVETEGEPQQTILVEDGWLGYCRQGRLSAFVFECPDKETAEAVLEQISVLSTKGGVE
jgi:hypothetical protein